MTELTWGAAQNVMTVLEENGFEAVIVGGAVRDHLLHKKPNDVDVATSALPQQVKSVFKKTIDVGIEHGTVLIVDFDEPVEVTTFRTEGTYSDHRRPDEVQFVRSLTEDLKRRDFTINAMAIRPDGTLVDLFGGQNDLDNQLIKAVGVAEERFSEDALRIIRAIRFSAQFDFKIEEKTALAMTKTANFLQDIAVERLKAEFDKIFLSTHIYNAMRIIEQYAIAKNLPGNYDHVSKWLNFQSIREAKSGWAHWCILTNSREVLSLFKCSNDEKLFAKQVMLCYEILLNGAPTKLELFQLDEDCWLNALNSYSIIQGNEHELAQSILMLKEELPIHHKNELQVDGKQLMQWSGRKGGPWLREVLDEILNKVLEKELPNDEQMIKEWFTDEWNV